MLERIVVVAALWLAACGGPNAAPSSGADATPGTATRRAHSGPSRAREAVELLEDPAQRAGAIELIDQLYEQALAADGHDRDGTHVQALTDVVVPPLVALLRNGELDGDTRGRVLALVADTRDPRALPALAEAIESHAMTRGPAGRYDDRMAHVLRHVQKMAEAGTIEPGGALSRALFGLFERTRFSLPKAQSGRLYRYLEGALVALAHPSWEDDLIAMLNEPIASTKVAARNEVLDQAYWQITATSVLGTLGSTDAITPLLSVTLSPMKAPVHGDAMIALLQIGEPALDEAAELLDAPEHALRDYAERESLRHLEDRGEKVDRTARGRAEKAYVDAGARLVALFGTERAAAVLLEAMDGAPKDERATIASYLHFVPPSPAVRTAFRAVYDRTGVRDRLVDGAYAKEALVGAAGLFFDRELLRHILTTADRITGPRADVRGVKARILGLGTQAAPDAMWKHVEALMGIFPEAAPKGERFVYEGPKGERELTDIEIVEKLEDGSLSTSGAVKRVDADGRLTPIEEVPRFAPAVQKAGHARALDRAEALLEACGQNVDCYLSELAATEDHVRSLKAAFMVGLHGDPSVKPDLLAVLPRVADPDARAVLRHVLLAHSPEGDVDLAEALRKRYEEALASRDREAIDRTKPVRLLAHQLEARATH